MNSYNYYQSANEELEAGFNSAMGNGNTVNPNDTMALGAAADNSSLNINFDKVDMNSFAMPSDAFSFNVTPPAPSQQQWDSPAMNGTVNPAYLMNTPPAAVSAPTFTPQAPQLLVQNQNTITNLASDGFEMVEEYSTPTPFVKSKKPKAKKQKKNAGPDYTRTIAAVQKLDFGLGIYQQSSNPAHAHQHSQSQMLPQQHMVSQQAMISQQQMMPQQQVFPQQQAFAQQQIRPANFGSPSAMQMQNTTLVTPQPAFTPFQSEDFYTNAAQAQLDALNNASTPSQDSGELHGMDDLAVHVKHTQQFFAKGSPKQIANFLGSSAEVQTRIISDEAAREQAREYFKTQSPESIEHFLGSSPEMKATILANTVAFSAKRKRADSVVGPSKRPEKLFVAPHSQASVAITDKSAVLSPFTDTFLTGVTGAETASGQENEQNTTEAEWEAANAQREEDARVAAAEEAADFDEGDAGFYDFSALGFEDDVEPADEEEEEVESAQITETASEDIAVEQSAVTISPKQGCITPALNNTAVTSEEDVLNDTASLFGEEDDGDMASLFGDDTEEPSGPEPSASPPVGAIGGGLSLPKMSATKLSLPKMTSTKLSLPKMASTKLSLPALAAPPPTAAANVHTQAQQNVVQNLDPSLVALDAQAGQFFGHSNMPSASHTHNHQSSNSNQMGTQNQYQQNYQQPAPPQGSPWTQRDTFASASSSQQFAPQQQTPAASFSTMQAPTQQWPSPTQQYNTPPQTQQTFPSATQHSDGIWDQSSRTGFVNQVLPMLSQSASSYETDLPFTNVDPSRPLCQLFLASNGTNCPYGDSCLDRHYYLSGAQSYTSQVNYLTTNNIPSSDFMEEGLLCTTFKRGARFNCKNCGQDKPVTNKNDGVRCTPCFKRWLAGDRKD